PGGRLARRVGLTILRPLYRADLDCVDILLRGRQGLAVGEVQFEVSAGLFRDDVAYRLDSGCYGTRITENRDVPGDFFRRVCFADRECTSGGDRQDGGAVH